MLFRFEDAVYITMHVVHERENLKKFFWSIKVHFVQIKIGSSQYKIFNFCEINFFHFANIIIISMELIYTYMSACVCIISESEFWQSYRHGNEAILFPFDALLWSLCYNSIYFIQLLTVYTTIRLLF